MIECICFHANYLTYRINRRRGGLDQTYSVPRIKPFCQALASLKLHCALLMAEKPRKFSLPFVITSQKWEDSGESFFGADYSAARCMTKKRDFTIQTSLVSRVVALSCDGQLCTTLYYERTVSMKKAGALQHP